MKKKEYHLFRYLNNEPEGYYLITVSNLKSSTYTRVYKDRIKLIKIFDDINEAVEFASAMNLL